VQDAEGAKKLEEEVQRAQRAVASSSDFRLPSDLLPGSADKEL
jgi:hypothetical protein